MRISREAMFMEIAHVVAKRATCFRLNVGALVVVSNRIVSIGYNGQAPGAEHCVKGGCAPGGCNTTHAEFNALTHVNNFGLSACHLYVTHSPCLRCAMNILNFPVSHVYFGVTYRDVEPLMYLVDAGVQCIQVLPSGSMIDFATGTVK